MNTKLSAVIMASVMLVVAFAAALTPSTESDAAIGTIDNPQYIIGTESVAYYLSGDSVTTKVSMNAKAFDGPTFTAQAYRYSTSEFTVNTETGVPNGTIVTDGNFQFTADNISGNHTIQFIKDSTSFTPGWFLIEVTLEDKVTNFNPYTTTTGTIDYKPVTLKYYYAANIETTETTLKVVLVDASNNELTETNDANEVVKKNLVFKKDKDYTGTFAKVKIGNDYLGADEYDFYESNLPDGIDMKSNGEIAGKIISSAALSKNNEFTVYAINKNTGKTILSDVFKYDVAESDNSDYFKYKIGDSDAKLYSVVGYSAIKNTDKLTVTILDVEGEPITETTGFTAAYSADGSTLTSITPAVVSGNLTVTLPAMSEYTGIVQLQITKTISGGSAYTAVIHVMLVGPLVHSGLEPTVTSA